MGKEYYKPSELKELYLKAYKLAIDTEQLVKKVKESMVKLDSIKSQDFSKFVKALNKTNYNWSDINQLAAVDIKAPRYLAISWAKATSSESLKYIMEEKTLKIHDENYRINEKKHIARKENLQNLLSVAGQYRYLIQNPIDIFGKESIGRWSKVSDKYIQEITLRKGDSKAAMEVLNHKIEEWIKVNGRYPSDEEISKMLNQPEFENFIKKELEKQGVDLNDEKAMREFLRSLGFTPAQVDGIEPGNIKALRNAVEGVIKSRALAAISVAREKGVDPADLYANSKYTSTGVVLTGNRLVWACDFGTYQSYEKKTVAEMTPEETKKFVEVCSSNGTPTIVMQEEQYKYVRSHNSDIQLANGAGISPVSELTEDALKKAENSAKERMEEKQKDFIAAAARILPYGNTIVDAYNIFDTTKEIITALNNNQLPDHIQTEAEAKYAIDLLEKKGIIKKGEIESNNFAKIDGIFNSIRALEKSKKEYERARIIRDTFGKNGNVIFDSSGNVVSITNGISKEQQENIEKNSK